MCGWIEREKAKLDWLHNNFCLLVKSRWWWLDWVNRTQQRIEFTIFEVSCFSVEWIELSWPSISFAVMWASDSPFFFLLGKWLLLWREGRIRIMYRLFWKCAHTIVQWRDHLPCIEQISRRGHRVVSLIWRVIASARLASLCTSHWRSTRELVSVGAWVEF
jgi:hypothetical protein